MSSVHSTLVHSSYQPENKCQICEGLDLNEFLLKWTVLTLKIEKIYVVEDVLNWSANWHNQTGPNVEKKDRFGSADYLAKPKLLPHFWFWFIWGEKSLKVLAFYLLISKVIGIVFCQFKNMHKTDRMVTYQNTYAGFWSIPLIRHLNSTSLPWWAWIRPSLASIVTVGSENRDRKYSFWITVSIPSF